MDTVKKIKTTAERTKRRGDRPNVYCNFTIPADLDEVLTQTYQSLRYSSRSHLVRECLILGLIELRKRLESKDHE